MENRLIINQATNTLIKCKRIVYTQCEQDRHGPPTEYMLRHTHTVHWSENGAEISA